MKYADVLAIKCRLLGNARQQPFCVVVPRIEKDGTPTLVLPYDGAGSGYIVFFDGGHTKTKFEWYSSTRAPRDDLEQTALDDLVERYRNEYGDMIYEIAIRQRLPHDWRRYAWGRP